MRIRASRARRTANEWRRLVAALSRSSRTVSEFAAARDLSPQTLSWWRWYLSRNERQIDAAADLRLVPIDVEPLPSASAAWEVRGATGDVLHVDGPLSEGQLALVLARLR